MYCTRTVICSLLYSYTSIQFKRLTYSYIAIVVCWCHVVFCFMILSKPAKIWGGADCIEKSFSKIWGRPPPAPPPQRTPFPQTHTHTHTHNTHGGPRRELGDMGLAWFVVQKLRSGHRNRLQLSIIPARTNVV